jgi:hypothetical protein
MELHGGTIRALSKWDLVWVRLHDQSVDLFFA